MSTAVKGMLEAAASGDKDRVLALLDAGADPDGVVGDAATEGDQTPLSAAVLGGHAAVAEALLTRGADPSPPEGRGGCLVTKAMLAGHIDLVNLLYRHGAAARLLIGFCFTDNYPAIGEILAREPHRWREYALDAIRSGNTDMLADNLRRNPSISPLEDGYVFLRSAIFQWRLAHRYQTEGFDRTRFQTIARMLLDWGIDPDVRGDDGTTNLHMCAGYGRDWSPAEQERASHAAVLLDAGGSVDVRDDETKSTPLGWACRYGRRPLVELLMSRGAPVDEPDAEPWATPLAWAEKMGHGDIAATLRAAGGGGGSMKDFPPCDASAARYQKMI